MDLDSVMEVVKELAGSGGTQYAFAVKAQYALLESRLRPDIPFEELYAYRAPLHYLCALRAISAVAASDGLTSPFEIKAGEVSIKNGFSRREITKCIEEFELQLSPLFKDEFVFKAVHIE